MTSSVAHRTRSLAAAALTLTLVGTVTVAGSPAVAAERPDSIALPDGFQPEGIEIAPGGVGYVGSRADGDIFRFDTRTGSGEIITEGPGTPSLGLAIDPQRRLFVAGGTGGDLRVVDGTTGDVLQSVTLTEGTSFINDVVVTKNNAYVTDSANATLYVLPLVDGPEPVDADAVRAVPLTGDWRQVEGTNANGITLTPDRRALLVVNSATGELFRVDRRTGEAQLVDLGGYSLTSGDGLLLRGTVLYVVRNRLNVVAVMRLSRDGTSGAIERTIESPRFDVPSTVADSGTSLFLPNARFTTTPTPQTAYSITRVAR